MQFDLVEWIAYQGDAPDADGQAGPSIPSGAASCATAASSRPVMRSRSADSSAGRPTCPSSRRNVELMICDSCDRAYTSVPTAWK